MRVTDEQLDAMLDALDDACVAFHKDGHPNAAVRWTGFMRKYRLAVLRSALSALSHGAGQDGEQCRAASGDFEDADDFANHLAQEIRRVDGNHSLSASALADAVTPFILRALSRGVPEDVMAKAIYEAHASAYTTLRLPAWEELGGIIGDATVEHWRAIARAAIAAQRKEG